MEFNAEREMVKRSARIASQPNRFRHDAKFAYKGAGRPSLSAEYADISLTGMRLVTRRPTIAMIGDMMKLEFRLPGSQKTIYKNAYVSRTVSETEFAVHFLDQDSEWNALTLELAHYADHMRRHRSTAFERVMHHYGKGLKLALIAAAVGLVIGGYVYLSSDYHNGKAHWWGNPQPKAWSLENLKNPF